MRYSMQYKPEAPASESLHRRTIHSLAIRACILIFIVLQDSVCFAQEIILRDLTRISEVPVTNIDDEFLHLADGQKLTWDQVLQSRVDAQWQESLDTHVKKFGLPLYRLKHRLRQLNVDGAFDIAKDWYENDAQTFSGHEANFLVCRAVMMGRIRRGERTSAFASMIRAIQLQEKCSATFLEAFPGLAFDEDELRTGICDELLPVWGSVEETQLALRKLDVNFDLSSLVEEWPGLAVYLSSMAVHIKQRERMTDWIPAMGAVPQLRQWQRVLGSDLPRTPLSRLIDGSEGALRVTAMYWWATAQEQQTPKRQRMLTLLKIVANYSQQFPMLAKEACAEAVELTDDPAEQAAIERILRQ